MLRPLRGAAGGGRVDVVYRLGNADESPLTYRLDSREQIATMRDAESRGLEIIGCFHSHTPPVPQPVGRVGGVFEGAIRSTGQVPAFRVRSHRRRTMLPVTRRAASVQSQPITVEEVGPIIDEIDARPGPRGGTVGAALRRRHGRRSP